MKLFIAIMFVFAYFFSTPRAVAETDKCFPGGEDEKFSQISAIPEIIIRNSLDTSTRYEEQYIAKVLVPLRRWGKNSNAIDQADVEKLKTGFSDVQSRQQFVKIFALDENSDQKVTPDEVRDYFSANLRLELSSSALNTQVENFMKRYDKNSDGVVDIKEMREYDIRDGERQSSAWTNLEDYIALDPNKDGVLTLEELVMLARKTFHTLDQDGSCSLTNDELDGIRKQVGPAKRFQSQQKYPLINWDDLAAFP